MARKCRIVHERALPWDDPARFDLLDALFDARYVRPSGEPPNDSWLDLALRHLERGETERAAKIVADITAPYTLFLLSVDNRASVLVGAHPERFMYKPAAERELELARQATQRSPRSLPARIWLISAMEDNKLYDEALVAVDRAVAHPDFDDFGAKENWLHQERSDLLGDLGRWQDAFAEVKRSASLSENGQPNTSQYLNAALVRTAHQLETHLQLGHEAEVRRALDFKTVD